MLLLPVALCLLQALTSNKKNQMFDKKKLQARQPYLVNTIHGNPVDSKASTHPL